MAKARQMVVSDSAQLWVSASRTAENRLIQGKESGVALFGYRTPSDRRAPPHPGVILSGVERSEESLKGILSHAAEF